MPLHLYESSHMLNLTNACWRWREIFLVLVACLLEASVHQIFSKAQFCSINDFSSRGFKMCDSFRVFRITQWGCFSGQISESTASIIPHSFPLLLKKIFIFICVCEKERGGKHQCVSAGMHTHAHADGRRGVDFTPLSDSIYSFVIRLHLFLWGGIFLWTQSSDLSQAGSQQATVILLSLAPWSWGQGSL